LAKIRKRSWNTPSGEPREAWVADYRSQDGKRHIRTFETKKAADQWLVTARHEVAQGIHTAPSASITVAQATERWIEAGEANGLERGSTRQRRQHLKCHIAPNLGGTKLAELTLPRVSLFLDALRDNGVSTVMRRKVLTSVKSAISYAQGQGWVAQNVARAARVPADRRREDKGPVRAGVDFPDKSQVSALVNHVSPGRRAYLLALCFTGMRIGEIRGLRWSDVDLGKAVIHVRSRADAWGKSGAPKSAAGKRDIPMVPLLVTALKERRLRSSGEGLVFPNGAGNPEWHQDLDARWWRPLQIAAGLVDEHGKALFGFHKVRHFAASLFIEHLHWTPKQIQRVMGHSSIQMTFDLYGHLFGDVEADRDDMAKLEQAALRAV